jgi:hypothetical protein
MSHPEGFHGVPVDSPSTRAGAREAQGHEFPWPKWRKLVLEPPGIGGSGNHGDSNGDKIR